MHLLEVSYLFIGQKPLPEVINSSKAETSTDAIWQRQLETKDAASRIHSADFCLQPHSVC